MHRALDAVAAFVRRVGFDGAGPPLRSPVFYAQRGFVALDPSSRKHLELTKALGANAQATLLATIDRTRTAMGSRMLARWLLAPLVAREEIEARADALEALLHDASRREALTRGAARLLRSRAHRAEDPLPPGAAARSRLAAAHARFARSDPRCAPRGGAAGEPACRCAAAIADFDELAIDLHRTLVAEPPATLGRRRGHPAGRARGAAETVALRTDGRARIAALEERERERTGIRSLKVKYASAFGYAIEISKNNLSAVPEDYVRRQTLTNGERFVTPELRELDLAIANAQTRQRQLEAELFETLVERHRRTRRGSAARGGRDRRRSTYTARWRRSPPNAATCGRGSSRAAESGCATDAIR